MLDRSAPQSKRPSSGGLEGALKVVSQKREQILQGAMQVFLASGYASTSMDRVAAVAGVSKQTIYSHFQDKEGLFKALMERVTFDRVRNFLGKEEILGEPEVVLPQLAEFFLTVVADQEYLSLLRLIIAESVRFPELAQLYTRSVIQRGRQLLSRYFQSRPELDIADPEAMAQIFVGSLVSYVLAQEILYGKETIPLERDRVITSLVDLMLRTKK
ncbi:MAG: TetR/AcrR family transcriptional regulator [Leptolyngbyaceae cyanobacterium HOT.MB2.61]|nr:TetR/AcrR family transcriptional regulator [Leptolyngbyaceae cyanobacterium HOT.MB2.61]